MTTLFALYPISTTADWHDEPFDSSVLPAKIVPGVTIERIKEHIRKDEFEYLKDHLSKRDVEALQAMNSVIIYRYGSPVAKARIRWFLGEKTSVYAPGDIQTGEKQPNITVGDVLDDLFELRNAVVHGDKTPDKFFLLVAAASKFRSDRPDS